MDISQAASLMAKSKKDRVKEMKSERKASACRANLEKARAKRWGKNNLHKGVDTTAQL